MSDGIHCSATWRARLSRRALDQAVNAYTCAGPSPAVRQIPLPSGSHRQRCSVGLAVCIAVTLVPVAAFQTSTRPSVSALASPAAVGSDGHCGDSVAVPVQDRAFATGVGVPQPDRTVKLAGRKPVRAVQPTGPASVTVIRPASGSGM
jgi:hypothetical protein